MSNEIRRSDMNEEQRKVLMSVFEGHKLKMQMHLNCDDKGILIHRCEELKLTRNIVTPKKKGRWGTGVASYFLDGDETEYTSLEDVAVALQARVS